MSKLKDKPAPRDTRDTCNPFLRDQMYPLNEVCRIMSISRRTLYRRIEDGSMPKPLDFPGIGPRLPGGTMWVWYEQVTSVTMA
jgi:predicted DNA-binding transcriptional regulator AlpA